MSSFSDLNILKVIDATFLKDEPSHEEFQDFLNLALAKSPAAICIYPENLMNLPKPFPLKVATVLNFPHGSTANDKIFQDIDKALETYPVEEFDYVFPYSLYLDGDEDKALLMAKEVINYCKRYNTCIKVIIESALFKNPTDIYDLSLKLIELNCDFIKTSTGKCAGASINAASAILKALKDTKANAGIKLSGGIKTKQAALSYMILAQNYLQKPITPDWFRLGASELIKNLSEDC